MRLKQTILLIGAIFLSVCLVGNVAAENKDGSLTVSTSVGKFWFDDDYSLQDNTQVGLAFGANLTNNWGVELGVNYVDSSLTKTILGDKKDVKMYFYHIDGLYHFMPQNQFVPYLVAGIGGMAFDPKNTGTENDYSVNYGAGFKIFLIDEVAIRGDVRNVISWDDVTDPDETYSNWMASLGLAFQFGGTKVTPPDGDADGDGVPDSLDKCPNTPAGSIVNAVGCLADSDGDGVFDSADKCPNTPNGVKVDLDGCPLDSDGDGVADFKDQCPNTPAGTQVDAVGCPAALDSDGDGVLDKDDQCSNTPKGAKVNRRGCWVVEGLLFNINKSTIKQGSEQGLNELADVLEKNPEMRLEIQGHTDNTGSLELNNRLSKARAQAVKDYLIDKGIAADRLEATGYGYSKPAESNATAEGRTQNRRVELNPM